ncbi:hypothetical protein OEZ85_010163 [Tetradesmus obliquus]|uniref:Uncharacterized protein n=1 Tax=Tetradesmus obliquus TaxID=3088 RepID=A0ABY8TLV5_TETOB|nr:hypothetical protein OEZ85_010163 [Tetradesmus obliquus]
MATQVEHIKWVQGTTFIVDGFAFPSPRCTAYFLTHCHSDHTIGLRRDFASTIYCSPVSARLLAHDWGLRAPQVQVLQLGQPLLLQGVTVTAIDANHCPGAVMLLFEVPGAEGSVTRILHTGDCRWQDALRSGSCLARMRVDTLMLDTTYAHPKHTHPPQEEAIRMMVEVMRSELAEEPACLFVVGSYHIGKERAYLGAAQALGCKVYADAAKRRLLQLLDLPHEQLALLTDDPSAARLHVAHMAPPDPGRLAAAYVDKPGSPWQRVVAFRPTGWTFNKLQVWREGAAAVVGVPYSEHSSWDELRQCVAALRPSKLIPTVNAGSKAKSAALVERFVDLMDLSSNRGRLDMFLPYDKLLSEQAGCLRTRGAAMAVDNTNFKGCWRPEEDEALRKAVSIHGEKNWSVVARHFNTLMGRPALLGRAPKQCRSRYLQQLVPGIKTGEWSPEEEEVLVDGHRQFGNQWTLIASMLPGRTETSVKNHYNCTARRKVPSDLSRMTTLQRYLASIGVISLSNTRSGKYPSLGSGYPSSSSSQFFHCHTAQAAAAAAAAAGTRSAGKAARGAVSPSPSHQYDMYDEEQQEQEQQLLQQQQQQEYEQVLAYQQHAAAECEEDHQQHYGQQYGYEQQYSEHTAAAAAPDDAEGAAAGLLQLARVALMHLEEEEEDEEADGSHAVKQEADEEADMQEDDAAGSGLARAQAQLRQLRASSSRQPGRHALGGSGGGWAKPELLPVVRSNSEDSDHTAEEEEGSPMAEANLKLQLQQALRPSSSSMGKGKRSPQGSSGLGGSGMPGSKRHRPMWQQPPSSAAAGAAAAPRLRPVLDVSSEPAGSSYGGLSLAAGEASPASPTPLRGSNSPAAVGGAPEPQAQLLALMMQAFMGAAAAGAASSSAEGQLPAAALSTSHLAAVARIMQLSGMASSPAAAAAAAAAAGSGAAGGGSSAVADMLAAMMQGDAAAGGAPAAAWSSTLEQHVRAAAGQ